MSAHAHSAFGPALRAVADGLSLPISDRVRILRELAGDLEALTDRLVDEGLPVEEARQRAEEALVPDAETLGALGRLHQPLYARLTRRVAAEKLVKWERWALGATTASVVALGVSAITTIDPGRSVAPGLWPVLILSGGVFAAAVAKTFQLAIKGDHGAPGRGLGVIIGLSCVTLLVGMGGAVVDVFTLARTLEAQPHLAGELLPAWLFRDATLLLVTMIVAMVGGLGWFVLRQWVARLEEQRREALGITRNNKNSKREIV
jgi:hypothetical protein